MENVKNLKMRDQRKGDRRRADEVGAFEGPDRRKADRRGGSSTAGEGHGAQGR